MKDDLIGKKINSLVVLSEELRGVNTFCYCQCDCGNRKWIRKTFIRNGHSKSCGCLAIKLRTKHGMVETRQYRIWRSMKKRCLDPKNNNYVNYGERGIAVCDRWKESFAFFWEDMKEGYSDKLSIDRIDNNKGYFKNNCRWITGKEQNLNKRNNRLITYGKKTKTLTEWAEEFNISKYTLAGRIEYGWDMDKALKTPARKYKRDFWILNGD